MAVAYLGLGTNIDDRAANLARAMREIGRVARVVAVSRIYETEPVGFLEQGSFWNCAVRVSTALPPLELLQRLKEIERNMGRVVTFANGPRKIDIDILFYDDVVIDIGALQIPHPRAMERAFVLRPLAEIAGDLRHPVTSRSISEAMMDLSGQIAEPVA